MQIPRSSMRHFTRSAPVELPLDELRERAEQGEAESQYTLGLALRHGKTPDLPAAQEWFRRAADQLHPAAMFELGMVIAVSSKSKEVCEIADALNFGAAELGDTKATLKLVFDNLFSFDPDSYADRDIDKLRALAQEGDADALYRVACLTHFGIGVEPDPSGSLYMMETAARKGSVMAQLFFDSARFIYGFDKLTNQDCVGLLERFARLKCSYACELLGHLYKTGLIVPANKELSFQWAEKAAFLGAKVPQFEVGLTNYLFKGVRDFKTEATLIELAEELDRKPPDFDKIFSGMGRR
jgi:TPR repeat protein